MDTGATSSGPKADVTGRARVRDLVREVVAEIAPAELALVDGLAQFDDATAVRRLRPQGGRREPLGFGLGEIVGLLTPVVWLALDQTAKKLADSAVDGAVKGGRAVLRKALRRKTDPEVIPPLTPEQLAEVRERVLETASQRGFAAERAEAIADAVVARLALAPAGPAPERPSRPAGSDTPNES